MWTIRFASTFAREFGQMNEAAKTSLDRRLQVLSVRPPGEWRRPAIAPLKGRECRGLHELRFVADRIVYRPLGYFGPGERVFTLVLWVTKKDGQYRPANYCERAARVRGMIESRKESCHEWPIE